MFGHYSDPFRAHEQFFVANERNHIFHEALDESTLEYVYGSRDCFAKAVASKMREQSHLGCNRDHPTQRTRREVCTLKSIIKVSGDVTILYNRFRRLTESIHRINMCWASCHAK